MDVEAFIAILAVTVLVVELTFTHFPQIVLMEIIACFALLAQTFQPMFTDIIVVSSTEVVLGRL